MKSVIQEASTLYKAIEQGWEKAGKPKEFCVRILQEPNKNFLGMTTKNAKIAIFFGKLDEQKQQLFNPQEIKNEKQQNTHQRRPQQRIYQKKPQGNQGQSQPQQSPQQQQTSQQRPQQQKPLQRRPMKRYQKPKPQ